MAAHPSGDPANFLAALTKFGAKTALLMEAELREVITFARTSAGLSTTRSGGISSVPEYGDILARKSV